MSLLASGPTPGSSPDAITPDATTRGAARPPRVGARWAAVFLLGLLVLGGGAPPALAPGGAGGVGEQVEDPVPVLVVPGWGDQAPVVEPIRRRLTEQGWPESRVVAFSFRDAFGSNQAHAEEIDGAVRTLMALTGASEVDVVAHSMGGLALRYYLRTGETAASVRRAVFLGTPHRGTAAAVLAWGDGGREMVPGSDFLMGLNQGRPVPEGVEALAIRTPVDLRVIPASSGRLAGPGVENLEICCPSHNALVDHEETFLEILRFLQEGPAMDAVPDVRQPG
jgi:triacylglycerol lipase